MAKPNPTLPTLTEQQITRFWSYIDKSIGQGPEGTCWEWKRGRNSKGYGAFSVGHPTYRSNRIAYLLSNYVEPGSLFVLHRCDNPPCCNPEHLFLGTSDDNNKDAAQKGRSALGRRNGTHQHPESVIRGEQQIGSKLTDKTVLSMRQLYSRGMPVGQLARMYKVSKATASKVVHNKSWRHLL